MKTNILFLGSVSPHSLVNEFPKFGLDRYKASSQIIKGMREQTVVDVISSPDIPSWPTFPKLFIKNTYDNEDKFESLNLFNFPIIKQLWIILTLFFAGFKYIIKHTDCKTVLIVPYIVFHHTAPARLLKIFFKDKVSVVSIIPDIFFPSGFSKMINKWAEKHTKESDAFVLYTGAMAEYLHIQHKPNIVMESLIDINDYELIKNKNDNEKTVILYTGALHPHHGVQKLLEMMKRISGEEIELWITGMGPLYSEIEKWPKLDSRIKFYGTVEKGKVLELQRSADILINPRSDDDSPQLSKYMFPSKTLEYMISGSPVIICPMSGIPNDYYNYLYTAKDGSVDALVEIVQQVLNTSIEERNLKGEKARDFIIKNKSVSVQGSRIVNLIKKLIL